MERPDIVQSLDVPFEGTFVGTYTHSMDSKKRLTIPSEWRDAAGDPRLFVLPGINLKFLYVVTGKEMNRRLEKFRQVSMTDARVQQFARAFFSRANLAPWDVQGRIRVSDELLEHAHLVNQVVLVGIGNRFELWSPELWKEQNSQVEPSRFEEAAQFIGF